MRILQLSDIHFGSVYDSQFSSIDHFTAVLDATKDIPVDAVVVTGDLADDGKLSSYVWLLDRIQENYGTAIPVLVTPGNHDDRAAMWTAYSEFVLNKTWRERVDMHGTFNKPGQFLARLGKTDKYGEYDHDIVVMDNGHMEHPYEALCRLKVEYPNIIGGYFLFVHMPVLRPFHLFMNDPSRTIADDENVFASALVTSGCSAIFCGHYHCESHESSFGMDQYAAPALQVQIDPFTETCNPSGNYPGYSLIVDRGPVAVKTAYVLPMSMENTK